MRWWLNRCGTHVAITSVRFEPTTGVYQQRTLIILETIVELVLLLIVGRRQNEMSKRGGSRKSHIGWIRIIVIRGRSRVVDEYGSGVGVSVVV